jgi:hypothetical protein
MDPFTFHVEIFLKKMYNLRDIWVSFRGKFQVVEIKSDTQTVHSFYKYMRKIRAMAIQELERRISIISLLYIIVFVNFLFLFKWSNGWMEALGE